MTGAERAEAVLPPQGRGGVGRDHEAQLPVGEGTVEVVPVPDVRNLEFAEDVL
jgi:hypothetical protein